ncbi:hypothetical protein F4811DRAFT_557148 [Daldinia bambusicola]|nr:hypothetical protein F4811DRAFT_557148 [Daldinia bambusicola]
MSILLLRDAPPRRPPQLDSEQRETTPAGQLHPRPIFPNLLLANNRLTLYGSSPPHAAPTAFPAIQHRRARHNVQQSPARPRSLSVIFADFSGQPMLRCGKSTLLLPRTYQEQLFLSSPDRLATTPADSAHQEGRADSSQLRRRDLGVQAVMPCRIRTTSPPQVSTRGGISFVGRTDLPAPGTQPQREQLDPDQVETAQENLEMTHKHITRRPEIFTIFTIFTSASRDVLGLVLFHPGQPEILRIVSRRAKSHQTNLLHLLPAVQLGQSNRNLLIVLTASRTRHSRLTPRGSRPPGAPKAIGKTNGVSKTRQITATDLPSDPGIPSACPHHRPSQDQDSTKFGPRTSPRTPAASPSLDYLSQHAQHATEGSHVHKHPYIAGLLRHTTEPRRSTTEPPFTTTTHLFTIPGGNPPSTPPHARKSPPDVKEPLQPAENRYRSYTSPSKPQTPNPARQSRTSTLTATRRPQNGPTAKPNPLCTLSNLGDPNPNPYLMNTLSATKSNPTKRNPATVEQPRQHCQATVISASTRIIFSILSNDPARGYSANFITKALTRCIHKSYALSDAQTTTKGQL